MDRENGLHIEETSQPGLEVRYSNEPALAISRSLRARYSDGPWTGSLKTRRVEYSGHTSTERENYGQQYNFNDHNDSKRIYGLRPVTFWLLLVIAVIVIASAVGGGVGGSLASQSNNKEVSGHIISSPKTSIATTTTLPPRTSPGTSSPSIPSSSPPPGCKETYNGQFTLRMLNATSTPPKLEASVACANNTTCEFTLTSGALIYASGQTGYVACNDEFSKFTDPAGICILHTDGFSLCPNGSFAFRDSALWYLCDNAFYWKSNLPNCLATYLTLEETL